MLPPKPGATLCHLNSNHQRANRYAVREQTNAAEKQVLLVRQPSGLYERAWRSELGAEFDAQHALRMLVTRLTDPEIDEFFELARTDGIMPLVRSTARFNRHRDLILALVRHPPARKILYRTLVG